MTDINLKLSRCGDDFVAVHLSSLEIVINAHLSNSKQKAIYQLSIIDDIIKNNPSNTFYILGDFNCYVSCNNKHLLFHSKDRVDDSNPFSSLNMTNRSVSISDTNGIFTTCKYRMITQQLQKMFHESKDCIDWIIIISPYIYTNNSTSNDNHRIVLSSSSSNSVNTSTCNDLDNNQHEISTSDYTKNITNSDNNHNIIDQSNNHLIHTQVVSYNGTPVIENRYMSMSSPSDHHIILCQIPSASLTDVTSMKNYHDTTTTSIDTTHSNSCVNTHSHINNDDSEEKKGIYQYYITWNLCGESVTSAFQGNWFEFLPYEIYSHLSSSTYNSKAPLTANSTTTATTATISGLSDLTVYRTRMKEIIYELGITEEMIQQKYFSKYLRNIDFFNYHYIPSHLSHISEDTIGTDDGNSNLSFDTIQQNNLKMMKSYYEQYYAEYHHTCQTNIELYTCSQLYEKLLHSFYTDPVLKPFFEYWYFQRSKVDVPSVVTCILRLLSQYPQCRIFACQEVSTYIYQDFLAHEVDFHNMGYQLISNPYITVLSDTHSDVIKGDNCSTSDSSQQEVVRSCKTCGVLIVKIS